MEIPTFAAGEEYLEPPDRKKQFLGRPRFSPLATLAEQLPSRENRMFARNMANRLWWLVMGRGLVMPLDLHHADNPATHPALLDLVAAEFAAHDYDMQWLLREMLLTETYQRSGEMPADWTAEPPPESYRLAIDRPLTPDQQLHSLVMATGMRQKLLGEKPLEGIGGKEFQAVRGPFLKALANPPREPEIEHRPSVKAALFLLNDKTVLGWLAPQEGNLPARLIALDDAAVAEELYLSVLTRLPDDDERALVRDHLSKHAEHREKALAQLAWSLLASTEFQVNH